MGEVAAHHRRDLLERVEVEGLQQETDVVGVAGCPGGTRLEPPVAQAAQRLAAQLQADGKTVVRAVDLIESNAPSR